ncbi:hypothetical protein EJB05_38127, partial [Eragrostis curvula]
MALSMLPSPSHLFLASFASALATLAACPSCFTLDSVPNPIPRAQPQHSSTFLLRLRMWAAATREELRAALDARCLRALRQRSMGDLPVFLHTE